MLLGVSGSWEDIDATSLPVELEPGPPSEKLTCQTCLKRERKKESLQRRKGKVFDPDLVVLAINGTSVISSFQGCHGSMTSARKLRSNPTSLFL